MELIGEAITPDGVPGKPSTYTDIKAQGV